MTEAGGQSCRLPSGGQVDRSSRLRFRFNGSEYSGFAGDTLASALLANGVRVVARSFKHHRPRGVFSAGEEEPCALVETGTGATRTPNCRATEVPLSEGLVAASQGAWPSLGFDAGRVFDYSHALWPAGFYNKTFMWPNWRFWEGLIRRAAGMGRAPDVPDPDRYEQVNAHCDLLVCGAGPAGLLAALAAGQAGLRVIVADQGFRPGGALNQEDYELDGRPGHEWAAHVTALLEAMHNVTLLNNTVAAGLYDHNVTTLVETGDGSPWRECFWTVRPRRVLITTGAIEQGLIFPFNDRPGIMLAGALRQYLNRYAVLPGDDVVVATNNDAAYQTVFDLARAGRTVRTVVDTRPAFGGELARRLSELGTELLSGARIAHTRGTRGVRSIRCETVAGEPLGNRRCDLLAVSGGWSPRVHLLAHARGALRFDAGSQSFLAAGLPAGMHIAGSANGAATLDECFSGALQAAADICAALGRTAPSLETPRITQDIITSNQVEPQKPDMGKPRQWIDLAHDVTLGDARLAAQEGYVSVEHFKRYTTSGMSLDQGKTSNLNAFIVLGELTGRDPGEVGTTTFRPPYSPVTLGAVAGPNRGEFHAPRRYLPAHRVHERLNGVFEDYGWQRPERYPQPGEGDADNINREVAAVRNAAGVFDNSPIGKLEVSGPDAADFLDRLYMNSMQSLTAGHARYGLMLNDSGVIIDDGVCLRLADDRFLLHTTSGGVQRVHAWMERWLQCEWPGLKVLVDDVTAQWANFTIAGPRSREVLAALGTDIDLSADALPHMAGMRGHVANLEARVVRVSYSGERSYEVNVPARYAAGFLEALLEAGRPFDTQPFGIEALMVLRTEKGYLHTGTDTDGSTIPDDVGWGAVARRKQTDYIGRRSLFLPASLEPGRRQLVGLLAKDPGQAIEAGGHLIRTGSAPPAPTEGWVTSACYSPTLGRHIALAVLRGGRGRTGEELTIWDRGDSYGVEVTSPVFYDPENSRLAE